MLLSRCHLPQLSSLYLIPTNLTHLLKVVQTSTYFTIITSITIRGLEDFTNLISSLVIKGKEFIVWALGQRNSLLGDIAGISSGHRDGKKGLRKGG